MGIFPNLFPILKEEGIVSRKHPYHPKPVMRLSGIRVK